MTMLYREYGKSGKKVSAIGFGGMRFKDIDNPDKCVEMMLEAAKAGINYFDTAPGYFGTKGEEVFGEGLKELRRQDLPFFCATKTFKSSEKNIRGELEQQLKRLGLDAIDFYHMWCVTNLKNWRERKEHGIIDAFLKLKEEGLIKHICVSSHLIGDDIRELLEEGIFDGVLQGYSAFNFHLRQAAINAVAEYGLGCVVMNPLGGGIIPQNPELFDFIKTRDDETVVEAALRFLLSQEQITTALVGFGEKSEIKEAISAVDAYKKISQEQIERIKSGIKVSFEGLCTGCRYCDHCPEGIPVPKFMDAYNHKKLYDDDNKVLERLKFHWHVPPEQAEDCVECGQCEEECTQHLPIIDRLKEIVHIANKAH